MTDQAMTIQDALKIAIKEEIKAHDLYLATSEKVTDPGSRAMLVELAQQELGHRNHLEKIINAGNYEKLGEKIPAESYGIAEFLVANELSKNTILQDVMIFAIKEEEKAVKFYTDLEHHFAGTKLENIFSRLAAEENGHKIKLEREYEDHYLKDN